MHLIFFFSWLIKFANVVCYSATDNIFKILRFQPEYGKSNVHKVNKVCRDWGHCVYAGVVARGEISL